MMTNCKGNALVYILIAIALLAALTYAVSGEHKGQQQNQLSEAKIKLLATDLIKHAVAAEMAVKQMEAWGIDYDEIKFDLPGTAGYNTDTTKQIYHPSGGGLTPMNNLETYKDPNWMSSTWMPWTLKNTINVTWTPSTAHDIIYSIGGLSDSICSKINNQILGDETPILAPTISFQPTFLGGHSSDVDLTTTNCPNCENISKGCIERSADSFRLFYSIIGSR